MLQRTSLAAVLISMSMAACGGGGSDETAVSANPPAPTPSPSTNPPAPTPAPSTSAPGAAPGSGGTSAPVGSAPAGAPSPAVDAAPGAAPVPSSPPAAAAPTVPGELVWAALERGVSNDPAPATPFSPYRQVFAADKSFVLLGGALESYALGSVFPGGGGLSITERVAVTPTISNGVISAVTANSIVLQGAPLDLKNVDPAVDATAGTWSSGQWSAKLVIQSVPAQAGFMRVCWDVVLPPPAPLTGPGGVVVQRDAPFRRLMCGIYSASQAGPERGGYVSDDIGGTKTVYVAGW